MKRAYWGGVGRRSGSIFFGPFTEGSAMSKRKKNDAGRLAEHGERLQQLFQEMQQAEVTIAADKRGTYRWILNLLQRVIARLLQLTGDGQSPVPVDDQGEDDEPA